jgi:hypothetical protein
MAVIVWWLDLQLPMQSVPITTDYEFEFRPGRGVQHYVITFVSDLQQLGGLIDKTIRRSSERFDLYHQIENI